MLIEKKKEKISIIFSVLNEEDCIANTINVVIKYM